MRPFYVPFMPPSGTVEYAYYLTLTYMVFAPALGVEVPFLAGLLIVGLAGLCYMHFRAQFKAVVRPISLLIATTIAFIIIQILFHDGSILDDISRAFVNWILALTAVYCLCLRPGFSLRAPVVMFLIGAVTLPFLQFNQVEVEMARVGVDVQGGLTHPGGLAEWFGFCAIFFAIFGLEADRFSFRVGAWGLAVMSLFVVTLAVERGPLFAAALAITVGFRRLLKRGFIPVLVLVMLAWGVYESGVFDEALSSYTERGFEETGREILWPAAIEGIMGSPIVGVGESQVNMRFFNKEVPPHNVFLHFALSAGVLPFALFLAFWVRAFWKAVRPSRDQRDDPFRLPYLVYTFVSVMFGDYGFMSPWAIFTVAVGAGSIALYRPQRRPAMAPARRVSWGRVRGRPDRPIGRVARSRF